MANIDDDFAFIKENDRANLKKLVAETNFVFILEFTPTRTVQAVNLLADDMTGVLLLATKLPKEFGELERLDMYYYLYYESLDERIPRKIALSLTHLNPIALKILEFSDHYDKAIVIFGGIETIFRHRGVEDIETFFNALYDNIAGKEIKIFIPIDPRIMEGKDGFTWAKFHRLVRALDAVVIGEK